MASVFVLKKNYKYFGTKKSKEFGSESINSDLLLKSFIRDNPSVICTISKNISIMLLRS